MPSSSTFLRQIAAISICLVGTPTSSFGEQATTGILDRTKVTAGQTFKLNIHFKTPPSYDGYLVMAFDYKQLIGLKSIDNPLTITCNGGMKASQEEAELNCLVPIDADGGTYAPRAILRIGPPPNGTRERTDPITVSEFEVVPVQDNNVYPTAAVATISLNQRQVLENSAETIEVLLDRLNTKVDGSSAETPDLKVFLADTANSALRDLETSRQHFNQTSKTGDPSPIFFEDFARQYSTFLVEVRAPKSVAFVMPPDKGPHFSLIQLSTRDAVTVHPGEGSGSLGPLVSKLATLLGNHMAAFLYIAKSGSTTFTMSLKSSPPGASISYKRIGEDYQDYSGATNVDHAEFPYALWTFRFSLGKCEVVKNPNPYIERPLNLNVSMLNCGKK